MTTNLNVGDVLENRYKILGRIGEGGMGVVLAAEHMMLNRRCAVKVLHPSEADDHSMLQRFRAEAQSAANIRHPNVVEVMDFGLTPDNRPFFVMEHLTGESLGDRIERQGRLSLHQSVEITDQILSGLIVAHKMGIIHRDLKPDNIFLSKEEGSKETVKILDFGISKIVRGTGSPSVPPPSATGPVVISDDRQGLTQYGVILGTPGYMSPEAIYGKEDLDHRSDLFSVTVLLFEMLMGRRPFKGDTPRALLISTTTDPVPKPTKLRPDLSLAMERLLLIGLAKEPKDRFQSAQEFLNYLSAAAVGRIVDDDREITTEVGMPSIAPAPAGNQPPASSTVNQDISAVGATVHQAMGPVGAPAPRPPSAMLELERVTPLPRKPQALPSSYLEDLDLSIPGTRKKSIWIPSISLKGIKIGAKRFSLAFTPIPILFLVGLGIAIYYLFIRQDPMVDIRYQDSVDESIAAYRANAAGGDPGALEEKHSYMAFKDAAELVTIWVDARPRKTTVHWGDLKLIERPLLVPLGEQPVKVRFSAPGHDDSTVEVTPDSEKTVKVRLIAQRKKKK